jgi:hypothetical protein
VEDVPAVLGGPVAGRERSGPLSLFARATGEIEIALEISRLADRLRLSTRPFASKRLRRSTSARMRVVEGSRACSKRFSSIAASESIGAS